jgi:hypothetical protein
MWRCATSYGSSGMEISLTEEHLDSSFLTYGRVGTQRTCLSYSVNHTRLHHLKPTTQASASSKLGERLQDPLSEASRYFARTFAHTYSYNITASVSLPRHKKYFLESTRWDIPEPRHQPFVQRRMRNDRIRDVRVRQPSRHRQLHNRQQFTSSWAKRSRIQNRIIRCAYERFRGTLCGTHRPSTKGSAAIGSLVRR